MSIFNSKIPDSPIKHSKIFKPDESSNCFLNASKDDLILPLRKKKEFDIDFKRGNQSDDEIDCLRERKVKNFLRLSLSLNRKRSVD